MTIYFRTLHGYDIHLLLKRYLEEEFHATPHSTNTYLVLTLNGKELAKQLFAEIERRKERIKMSFWQKAQAEVAADEQREEDEDMDEKEEEEEGTCQQNSRKEADNVPASKNSEKRKFIVIEEEDMEEREDGEEGREGDGDKENQNDQEMSSDIEIISREQYEASRLHSSKKPKHIVISSDSE